MPPDFSVEIRLLYKNSGIRHENIFVRELTPYKLFNLKSVDSHDSEQIYEKLSLILLLIIKILIRCATDL